MVIAELVKLRAELRSSVDARDAITHSAQRDVCAIVWIAERCIDEIKSRCADHRKTRHEWPRAEGARRVECT